jgi:uncharacterized membrane protein
MKRACVVVILILAFFGLADSIYLAQHALNGTPLLCTIQSFSDCNTVVTSSYSRIFGIPIAELGVLFYSIMFVLAALELVMYDQFLRRVLQAFSLVGILASLYFMFVQTFVIRAFCVYCLASAFIALLIFIFASMIEPIKRRTAPPAD